MRISMWLLLGVWPSWGQYALPEKAKANFRVNFNFDIGGMKWRAGEQLPLGWQSRFEPASRTMATSHNTNKFFLEMAFEAEPRVFVGRWEIGFPVGYAPVGMANLRNYGPRKLLTRTQLFWWDIVTLQERAVRRTSPSVGISLTRGWLEVRPSVQRYEASTADFAGKDCIGCVNSSYEISRTVTSEGWLPRGEIFLRFAPATALARADPYGAVGVFVEKVGGLAWNYGVRIKLSAVAVGR
jgi:hypothetical protein